VWNAAIHRVGTAEVEVRKGKIKPDVGWVFPPSIAVVPTMNV
jgi:hypothetical protein